MGQAPSRVVGGRNARKGIIVSFDALGTLYTFKQPFAQQYLQVAQRCGLKDKELSTDEINWAFGNNLRYFSRQYPNYGKGVLDSPRVWWQQMTESLFSQITAETPPNLGNALYDHFASGDAYMIYPDVQPFLDGIHRIRQRYADADGPGLVTGVLTNSDPRVHNILKELSITTGNVSKSALMNRASMSQIANGPPGKFRAPWTGAYDPQRHFDFLSTSYDSGFEKPHAGAFRDAEQQAAVVMLGKSTQHLDHSVGLAGLKTTLRSIKLLNESIDDVGQMRWIHVGDEVAKDIEGAKAYGIEALLIDRENKHANVKERVASLEEVASIINVLVEETFVR